jgi:long-chain acyl-CoA synthetase
MLVQDFLEASVLRSPDKVALVCQGERLTYMEIDRMANRLAHGLIHLGVRRGDRVAIYLTNSVNAVVGIFAVLKAGGTFVVLNRATKFEKLRGMINNSGATALIADARAAEQGLTERLTATLPSVLGTVITGSPKSGAATLSDRPIYEWEKIQELFAESAPARQNIDLDLACLIYTSGTTGDSKGVMCDHSNVVFAAESIIAYLRNGASDIVINFLPLSFDYGLYQLLMVFKFGGTLVLENSFTFPLAILDTIQKEKVTGLPGVPTVFALLLQADVAAYDLSSLRYLTNTAAALPASHVQQLRSKFPQATVYSMYGLTETKRTLYLPPESLDKKPGSVGIAIPGTEVWLENAAGQKVGPGVTGELVVRGRHVMRGYWKAPEASAARFRPGPIPGERLCYTGDQFKTDEDGYLYFIGRRDDIIKCRGEKVSPKEIEDVLHALPGVVEAAVLGVPDEVLGQAIKAVLVPADNHLTCEGVKAHCLEHLEPYLVPKFIEFRQSLPKSASGKVRKEELI